MSGRSLKEDLVMLGRRWCGAAGFGMSWCGGLCRSIQLKIMSLVLPGALHPGREH